MQHLLGDLLFLFIFSFLSFPFLFLFFIFIVDMSWLRFEITHVRCLVFDGIEPYCSLVFNSTHCCLTLSPLENYSTYAKTCIYQSLMLYSWCLEVCPNGVANFDQARQRPNIQPRTNSPSLWKIIRYFE